MSGTTSFRVGQGYDLHRLTAGRRLVLGGVEVPYELGLLGHSDADVLVHAVMDALLGAAAMGDIGRSFPPDDERYRGANSVELLRTVAGMLAGAGFSIGNIDATVVAQRPKLAQYIPAMRINIARACSVEEGRVSVKATTEEGLGATGAGEAMAAHAVALIYG